MPRKKLEINATKEEIQSLVNALEAGAPLYVALEFAGISRTTFYYWVAMYSIVLEGKSQDELEDLKADKFGVSINQIKDISNESTTNRRTAMGVYIEPSAEAMLNYRNNLQFKRFAEECYDIVRRCNEARSKVVLGHLGTIMKSTKDKRVNASGSMWYLERTYAEFFSKPNEKAKDVENEKIPVQKVEVEFIDPAKPEDKDRIKNMEQLIISEQKGIGES